jgi:hypothetical protein
VGVLDPVENGASRRRRARRVRTSRLARLASAALAISVALLCMQPAARAAVFTGVMTGRADTWDPSAAVDASSRLPVLAWTRYRRGHPDAFLRIGAQPKVQLDRSGMAWAWSLDQASSTAAFQAVRRGNSDVRLYDWRARRWSKPAGSVDTARWEYEPSVSGPWLVFGRLNRAARPHVRRIILQNLQTGKRTVLATFSGSSAQGMLSSPQIEGDWVTWTSMSDRYRLASVHRYQISTATKLRIAHPSGMLDYQSAVGADGTVYFLQSRGGCGRHVRFESYTTGGVLTELAAMPAGRDGGDEMFAQPQPGGVTDLYFDSYRCASTRPNGDISMLAAAAAGGAAGRIDRATARPAPATRPKALPPGVGRELLGMEGRP